MYTWCLLNSSSKLLVSIGLVQMSGSLSSSLSRPDAEVMIISFCSLGTFREKTDMADSDKGIISKRIASVRYKNLLTSLVSLHQLKFILTLGYGLSEDQLETNAGLVVVYVCVHIILVSKV